MKNQELPQDYDVDDTKFQNMSIQIDRSKTQLQFIKNNDVYIELKVIKNDITQEKVGAITNAANENLILGGGVAGAIKRNGGGAIQKECNEYIKNNGPLNVGESAVTSAGKLQPDINYIIHAVGPMYNQHGKKENCELLYNAVTSVLEKAEDYNIQSISIPAISSGIFGFPKPLCAQVMFRAVEDYLYEKYQSSLNEIRFTNFDDETVDIFKKELLERFEKYQKKENNLKSNQKEEEQLDKIQDNKKEKLQDNYGIRKEEQQLVQQKQEVQNKQQNYNQTINQKNTRKKDPTTKLQPFDDKQNADDYSQNNLKGKVNQKYSSQRPQNQKINSDDDDDNFKCCSKCNIL